MNPQRGEIYSLPFGDGKPRPVVVVSRDKLNGGNSVIVVPFTRQKLEVRKQLKSCAFFRAGEGRLDSDCVAKADEITRIDKAEMDWSKGSFGRMNPQQMQRIVDAIRYVVRDSTLKT